MSEMAHPGQYHRHALLIGGRNHFFVANAAAWLNNRRAPA